MIGLRNTIVHEYMKVNRDQVTNVILEKNMSCANIFLLPFESFLGEN
jgi:uncharacterized protein YutE (UPF0331/DUF86 family)